MKLQMTSVLKHARCRCRLLPAIGLLLGSVLALGGCGDGSSANESAKFSMFYSFPNGVDGVQEVLIQGSDGNTYALAEGAITSGTAYVLKITPAGVGSLLYSFSAGAYGTNPMSLIQGIDGNLYGTTSNDGAAGNGTVFKITPAGVESVLYSFEGGAAGANPASLIQSADGSLYGATSNGGATGAGTVFKITPAGIESVLYSFAGGADGADPTSLIQASDGNVYGVTQVGGLVNCSGPYVDNIFGFPISPVGCGAVVKITPSGTVSLLYRFQNDADGYDPTHLIQGSDGNLYGVTLSGGVGGASCSGKPTYSTPCGTVFKLTLSGDHSVLHSFQSGVDGYSPNSLLQGTDGTLYGATFDGGSSGFGTIFGVTTAGVESLLYPLDGTHSTPWSLIQGSGGNLYGLMANPDQPLSLTSSESIFELSP